MSYRREIPRDLFNEANLLKCYGQIYLNLEKIPDIRAELVHLGDAFIIDQDYSDGSISIENVHLMVRGKKQHLSRSLNARSSWPLYLTTPDDDVISVFKEDGSFSSEMIEHLTGTADRPRM